jgi:hypothetical protein
MKNDKQYYSILQWIVERGVVSEKGDPLDFTDRPFLLDILSDWTPEIVCTACAQVGKSVTFSYKALFAAKHLRFNIIYTMPTDGDAKEFVGTKFNEIIKSNRIEFAGMETDSVERKELNKRYIYFKGTIGKSAAVSTTADVLIHDELSRSDQSTIETFRSRTKASPYKGRWMFSNPGAERDELDLNWQRSDQKEWAITCPHCKDEHHMIWPDSIDVERQVFICRKCKKQISDNVRRKGKWVDRDGRVWNGQLNPRFKVSGWHISHLMCAWISAAEIIEDSKGDPAYFNNFVLGLSYSPGDLQISRSTIMDIWTPKDITTREVYLGVDVGNIKHYVVRSRHGIIKLGKFSKDSDIDDIISFWKPTSGVIDALPNTVLSNYVIEKYPFMKMSYFQENQINPQVLVWWGEKERAGIVYSHRDRILDQHLDNLITAKWRIGVVADKMFQEYIKHYETLRRVKVVNNRGIERYVWESTTGEDHFCFADLYSYLSMLGEGAGVFFDDDDGKKPSVIDSDNVYDVSRMFSQNNDGYYE